MPDEVAELSKRLVACFSLVRFFSNMGPLVCSQMGRFLKTLRTLTALKRSLTAVQLLVGCKVCRICETPWALLAFEWFLAGVYSRMPDHCRGLSKRITACFAFLPFLSGVRALTDGQVRQVCKATITFLAFIRLLACVHSHMPGEMGGMTKSFAAYFAFICFRSSMLLLVHV